MQESMEQVMAKVLLEQGVSNLVAAMQGGSPRDYAKVLANGIIGMAQQYHDAEYLDQAQLREYRRRISEVTAGLWS